MNKVPWPMIAGVLAGLVMSFSSVSAQSSVEQAVRAKFRDVPVMITIARCESRFRQYTKRGKPLYNAEGSSAVGVFQIMSSIHGRKARLLGHDILKLDGNMAYALYLYKKEGTRPWRASKACWG